MAKPVLVFEPGKEDSDIEFPSVVKATWWVLSLNIAKCKRNKRKLHFGTVATQISEACNNPDKERWGYCWRWL